MNMPNQLNTLSPILFIITTLVILVLEVLMALPLNACAGKALMVENTCKLTEFSLIQF